METWIWLPLHAVLPDWARLRIALVHKASLDASGSTSFTPVHSGGRPANAKKHKRDLTIRRHGLDRLEYGKVQARSGKHGAQTTIYRYIHKYKKGLVKSCTNRMRGSGSSSSSSSDKPTKKQQNPLRLLHARRHLCPQHHGKRCSGTGSSCREWQLC